jgi:hypothetical protein
MKNEELQAVAYGEAFGTRCHFEHNAQNAGKEREGHAHRICATREPKCAFLVGYSGHPRVLERLGEKVDGPSGLVGGAQDLDALERVAERVKYFVVCLLEFFLCSFDFSGVFDLYPCAQAK